MARRAAFGGLTVNRPTSNSSHVEHAGPHRIDDDSVWYVMQPEVRSGALRFAEVRLLVNQHKLRINDLIWRPGWEQWQAASGVPGLFPFASDDTVARAAPTGKLVESNVKDRVKRELRSYFVITVYIWTVLVLLRLHESLIANSYGLDLKKHCWLILNALVLGKVVLIAEALHVGERISKAVPALGLLIRSLLFAFLIVLFHHAEHVVMALWSGEDISQHLSPWNGANIKRSLATAGLTTLALIPYFLVKDIETVTGQSDLLLRAIGFKSGSRQDQ